MNYFYDDKWELNLWTNKMFKIFVHQNQREKYQNPRSTNTIIFMVEKCRNPSISWWRIMGEFKMRICDKYGHWPPNLCSVSRGKRVICKSRAEIQHFGRQQFGVRTVSTKKTFAELGNGHRDGAAEQQINEPRNVHHKNAQQNGNRHELGTKHKCTEYK